MSQQNSCDQDSRASGKPSPDDIGELAGALGALGVAYALFDSDDRLHNANHVFEEIYAPPTGLSAAGVSFTELVRLALEDGRLADLGEPEELWIERRRRHRHTRSALTSELVLGDGRRFLSIDGPTESGGSLALRVDMSELDRLRQAFREFSHIVASRQIEPEVKITRILSIGCKQLALTSAAVLRLTDCGYETAYAHPPGEVLDIGIDTAVLHHLANRPCSLEDGAIGTEDGLRRRMLVSPIRIDEEPFGYVLFAGESWREEGDASVDLEILSIFAEWIGHELARERDLEELDRAHRELERLATTDELTGLPNRRSLMIAARAAFERARSGDNKLAVAIVDIDHFKSVNDTYGHETGDRMLQLFAESAKRALDSSAPIGRLGGEEFAVVLPGLDAERAIAETEKLRQRVAAAILAVDGILIGCTVSIGVSALSTDDGEIGALLKRADVALYQAKQLGRNRVVSADTEPVAMAAMPEEAVA